MYQAHRKGELKCQQESSFSCLCTYPYDAWFFLSMILGNSQGTLNSLWNYVQNIYYAHNLLVYACYCTCVLYITQ